MQSHIGTKLWDSKGQRAGRGCIILIVYIIYQSSRPLPRSPTERSKCISHVFSIILWIGIKILDLIDMEIVVSKREREKRILPPGRDEPNLFPRRRRIRQSLVAGSFLTWATLFWGLKTSMRVCLISSRSGRIRSMHRISRGWWGKVGLSGKRWRYQSGSKGKEK